MEKSNLTDTENGEICEEQGQECAHHLLRQQADSTQRIHPGRPNSQFCMLLRHFTTAWKCAKTSLGTVVTKKLVVALQRTVSLFLSHRGIFDQKQHECRSPLTTLAWLGPMRLFYFPPLPTILAHLGWSRQNRRRCWTLSQNTTSKMDLKNDKTLGYARKVITSNVLVTNRPQVSFDQLGARVPELWIWVIYSQPPGRISGNIRIIGHQNVLGEGDDGVRIHYVSPSWCTTNIFVLVCCGSCRSHGWWSAIRGCSEAATVSLLHCRSTFW
jgi:hypothetical protein